MDSLGVHCVHCGEIVIYRIREPAAPRVSSLARQLQRQARRSVSRPARTRTSRAGSARPKAFRSATCFRFVSALYFRGKLTYARHFAVPPEPGESDHRQRRPGDHADCRPAQPGHACDAGGLRQFLAARTSTRTTAAYRRPLERSARALAREIGALRRRAARQHRVAEICRRAARRSSATGCRFPVDFVGRGDMSRGGLLLRQAAEGVELRTRRSPAPFGTARDRRSSRRSRTQCGCESLRLIRFLRRSGRRTIPRVGHVVAGKSA